MKAKFKNYTIVIKKKDAYTGILVVISVLVLTVILFCFTFKPIARQKSVPRSSLIPQTTLTFIPSTLVIKSGSSSEQYSSIFINTHGDSIYGASLEIDYNPAVITNISLTGGSFLPLQMWFGQIPQPVYGRLSYRIVIPIQHSPIIGSGVLANLTFTINKQKLQSIHATQLLFTSKTIVSASKVRRSGLQSVTNENIVYNTQ